MNKEEYEISKEKRRLRQVRYRASLSPEQKEINRIRDRERHSVKRYGITEAMYDDMCTKQGDMCCICKKHKDDIPVPSKPRKGQQSRAFVIDHCHESNKVRGLLCGKCNTALGGFNDDIELLRTAIEYLQG
tara:strand:+ start:109 stop:501 length:393 start_codon:yes stop_codon:yes gene_type:complete